MPQPAENKFEAYLIEAFAKRTERNNLYTLLWADEQIASTLNASLNAAADAFGRSLCQNAIEPAACSMLGDVFRQQYRKDGVEYILDYAKTHPFLTQSKQFEVVRLYLAIERYAKANDVRDLVPLYERCAPAKQLRADMATYIQLHLLSGDVLGGQQYEEMRTVLMIMNGYWKNGKPVFVQAHQKLLDAYTQRAYADAGRKSPELIAQETAQDAMLALLMATAQIRMATPNADLRAMMIAKDSELSELMKRYLSTLDARRGKKIFLADVQKVAEKDADLAAWCKKMADELIPESLGFFARLFKK